MRMIDADALIKDIDYSADMGGALGKVVECVKYYAKFMVASAPTIERKTGKWMHDKDDELFSGYCSCCGWASVICETDVADMPYCPNCGADMRKTT